MGNGSHAPSSGNGSIGIDVSDSADSRRSARMAMKKKRVHRSRARKHQTGGGQRVNFIVIAVVIFLLYLLVCLIFFRNLPDSEGKGMRGLVKKTKEKVDNLRGKISKENNVHDEVQHVNNSVQEEVAAPKSAIPIGKWPISIRDEDGKFDDIKHPGFEDGHVTMSVPSFWADDPVAIHENKLMSRERALSIGTCVTPDPKTGSNTRGDKCPLNERTIFVAIASYRDWQCRDTVTSIFSAATHPERIRVAVVDQIVVGEDGSCDIPHSPCPEDPNQPICLYKNQIDVYQMEAGEYDYMIWTDFFHVSCLYSQNEKCKNWYITASALGDTCRTGCWTGVCKTYRSSHVSWRVL